MGIGSFWWQRDFVSFALTTLISTRKIMQLTEMITAAQFILPDTTSTVNFIHLCLITKWRNIMYLFYTCCIPVQEMQFCCLIFICTCMWNLCWRLEFDPQSLIILMLEDWSECDILGKQDWMEWDLVSSSKIMLATVLVINHYLTINLLLVYRIV